ncbi:hypothetical protein JW992_02265 [candidate division KSB1 bacterium]|nr:hypothetical protein [candidate division KSB1 bacterium]
MKNIYYFSSLDLVVRICQSQGKRIIHFTTHRRAEKEELRQVETFIVKQFDLQKSPSSVDDETVYLLYLGVEESLPPTNSYQMLQGTIKDVISKRQIIDQQVKHLIDTSLSTYYFEKLGEKLITLRRAMHQRAGNQHIEKIIQEIRLLLDAYNLHAGQNMTLDQILPREASHQGGEG